MVMADGQCKNGDENRLGLMVSMHFLPLVSTLWANGYSYLRVIRVEWRAEPTGDKFRQPKVSYCNE